MLSKSEIRKMANAAAYLRGVDLCRLNRVEELQVRPGTETDVLRAKVKGSGRNGYNVYIAYHRERHSLVQTSCDCPAFFSYRGICKHCVAVLLTYLDYKKHDGGTAWANRTDGGPAQGEVWAEEDLAPEIPTTPAMKLLLSKQLLRRTAPILQRDVYGKVRLEPYLTCDSQKICLEFKIGITHMYVLKDVFEFGRNMEGQADFRYGQKLRIAHIPEAFEEESRPLVGFLLNWIRQNRKRYLQPDYYGYGGLTAKTRVMSLSTGELEELVDAAGENGIAASLDTLGEGKWFLTEEDLPRTLEITGTGQGILLKTNAFYGFVCSTCRLYFHDGKIYKVLLEEIAPIQDFLDCIHQVPDQTVRIGRNDVPLFCREMLPILEKYFECKKIAFRESEYGMPTASFEIYLDAPQRDFVTCKVLAVYGEQKYNVFDTKNGAEQREPVREMEVRMFVSDYFNAYEEAEEALVLAEDEDRLYELLAYGIPKMQEQAEVFVSDTMKRLKVAQAPSVGVGVALSGNLLELTVTSGDLSREQIIEILSKYNKKKKFYRLKNGDFVNLEGEGLSALMELKTGLNLTERQLLQGRLALPKYRALYLDAELKEWQSLRAAKDKEFRALVRNMKTVEDNDFEVPPSLEDTLREYQKRGFLWLKTLKQNGFGGILADDMGLGKTVQVIAFFVSERQEGSGAGRCLVVSPASLVYNWNSEIERFAPSLSVRMVVGTAAERRALIREAGEQDILLTSYDLLKRDIEHYQDMTFSCQVIDEAQFIKNCHTQTARAVKLVEAGFKVALTGTPVENRLSELWSIFDYLMPGFLYTYQKFRTDLETPIVQNGEEAALLRLQKMIKPFVLRRLKRDVLKDLPDKLEEDVYARPEGEQQKLYDAHVKRLQMLLDKQTEAEFRTSKIQILSELTKLRQLCCDPALLYEDYGGNSAKTEMCLELIGNAVNGGHKILLFSQFTSMLERLQERLLERKISFYTLTGSTGKEKRKQLVEDFNKDLTSVFCISLKAGGTGLNLASADIVIHYDPWWNLAVQEQATDRAHRIGQKNVVTVYRLLVKGTIEENITKLQERKRELAQQVLGGEGMDSGSFTREELLELLK
ncbi:MAG: DEAD/DEAH box helicase [Clostridium sp.]|jgi:hypothetical protein|nr:DEAD/DEAH box helicase [Clostridium sp.]